MHPHEYTADDLREIIREIPGYDPYRDSAGFYFDAESAKQACDFFPEHLQHIEGSLAGQPFELQRWQIAIVANMFGWKSKTTGSRRYDTVLLYVARKNGKTPLIAGICVYVLHCDTEEGQQDYCAAASKDQANHLFRWAYLMIEQNPELASATKIYKGVGQRAMETREKMPSYFRVISADSETAHGQNAHLVVVDEVHAQSKSEFVHTLRTGMVSENRQNQLTLYVTTADYMRNSICNEIYDEMTAVRDGRAKVASSLPVIYETLPDEDWTDLDVIAKANPNLGVSVDKEKLGRLRDLAERNPAFENEFRRLHCNQRTESIERLIPMGIWDRNDWVVDEEDLLGRRCYGGLDLSSRSDMTAFVLVFPPADEEDPDGLFDIWPFFWLPEEAIEEREREEQIPYRSWVDSGHLLLTPGDHIDVDIIRTTILDCARKFELQEIGFDKWGSAALLTYLQKDGHTMFEAPQGFAAMGPPTKDLLEMLGEEKFAHGAHPVLRYHAQCAVGEWKRGYVRPSKEASSHKIDGIIAMVLALDRCLRHVAPPVPDSILL